MEWSTAGYLAEYSALLWVSRTAGSLADMRVMYLESSTAEMLAVCLVLQLESPKADTMAAKKADRTATRMELLWVDL